MNLLNASLKKYNKCLENASGLDSTWSRNFIIEEGQLCLYSLLVYWDCTIFFADGVCDAEIVE